MKKMMIASVYVEFKEEDIKKVISPDSIYTIFISQYKNHVQFFTIREVTFVYLDDFLLAHSISVSRDTAILFCNHIQDSKNSRRKLKQYLEKIGFNIKLTKITFRTRSPLPRELENQYE